MIMAWIESGNYGETVGENGHIYYWIYPWYVRWFIQPPIKLLQKVLWLCGIAIHDPVFGECTSDFNCCFDIGRKRFIHWCPCTKR